MLHRNRAGWASVGFYLRGWAIYFFEYVPGLALLTALAFLAKSLGRASDDSFAVLYATLAGVLLRNFFGLPTLFEPGTRTYEIFWKSGIVILGSQMGFRSLEEVGLKGLSLAGLDVLVVIIGTLVLARWFKIPAPLRHLLAIGMGVCGVSAIVALAGAVRTDDEDTGYAISAILVFGVTTMGLLPFAGRLLHLTDFHFGLWAGLSVNNTAEAVATGFAYSEAAGHFATLAKLARNLFLGVALLTLAQRMVGEGRD